MQPSSYSEVIATEELTYLSLFAVTCSCRSALRLMNKMHHVLYTIFVAIVTVSSAFDIADHQRSLDDVACGLPLLGAVAGRARTTLALVVKQLWPAEGAYH